MGVLDFLPDDADHTLTRRQAGRHAEQKPRSSKLEKHEAKQKAEKDSVKLRKAIRTSSARVNATHAVCSSHLFEEGGLTC